LYVAKLDHFFKHFASLHFAKKAKMTLLEERACYFEHHKLAYLKKQKLQKCYLAYLKKQNLQLAHCNRKQEL